MMMSFNYYASAPTFIETRNEAFVLTLMEALKETKNGCRVTGIQFAQPETAECATIWIEPVDEDIPYDKMLEFVSFHWKDHLEIWKYIGNGTFQFYKTRKGPYFDALTEEEPMEAELPDYAVIGGATNVAMRCPCATTNALIKG